MPSISIIVPVYNSELYISQCIESVLHQSYKDFELILVDDGSSDSSAQICRAYQASDERIIFLQKKNGGVSSARNAGIHAAKGEWITFIDSDDWVDIEYIERLHELSSIAKDSDLISTGIRYVYANGEKENCSISSAVCDMFNEDDFLSVLSQPFITSPVAKLYKHKHIIDNNILFPLGLHSGEDRAFNLNYLQYCKLSVRNKYIGYNYRRDLSDSLSVLLKCNEIKVNIEYWNNLYNLFRQRNTLTIRAKKYLVGRIYSIILDYIMCPRYNKDSLNKEFANINWDFIKENNRYINSPIYLKLLLHFHQFNILRIIYLLKNK